MTTFILIAIIIIIALVVTAILAGISKKKSKQAIPTNPTGINNLERSLTLPTSDITPIKSKQSASKETEFVINPGSPFELTLLGADNALGKQIQNIFLDDKTGKKQKIQDLVALFAEYNLRVKEIEAYKEKYAKVYFDKLEELKNTSAEWQTAGELDRKELLEEFREVAIKGIYERANCNLATLFEKEPKDFSIDDALIQEYGFENIQTYLRFANNLEKVNVIAHDSQYRQGFEKLVELGLSIRGSAIPMEEILSTLTLKDLNEMANHPEKQFKRKNQAVEFILSIPKIEDKIGSKVSFRELFKLNPIPEKFGVVNLQEISSSWSYTYEIVQLFVDTYNQSSYTEFILKNNEYIDKYSVECWGDDEEMCPYAKELINKKYPKSKPPRIPYHIGCDCTLRW
jgi:hypothetical protein